MNIILKKAVLVNETPATHWQQKDIKIEKGIITQIDDNIPVTTDYKEITLENLHVSIGWIDPCVCFGEPGFEDCETIANGLETAAKAGFTAIGLQPHTIPIADNETVITFLKQKGQNSLTSLYPIGALTKQSEGKDLAALYDMKQAGAVAFTDYKKSIANTQVQKIALQYLQDFKGLYFAFCQDRYLAGNGVVHEGETSIKLGLKGIPLLAEEIEVSKLLALLEYTGGKLHFPTLSSPEAIKKVALAKEKGMQVSCGVAIHQLLLNDSHIATFDTRYKVLPPLVDEKTRLELVALVKEGLVDCLTSDHLPLDIERKKVEFDIAHFGSIGLESAFGSLQNILPLNLIIKKLTYAYSLFEIEKPKLEIGAKANLTLFNPDVSYTFTEKNIYSKSKNSAFINQTMKGKVYGSINNNIAIING